LTTSVVEMTDINYHIVAPKAYGYGGEQVSIYYQQDIGLSCTV
jgi:hypothetical protein